MIMEKKRKHNQFNIENKSKFMLYFITILRILGNVKRQLLTWHIVWCLFEGFIISTEKCTSHFSETPILLGINEQSFWNVNTLESYLQTTLACVFLTEALIFKLKNPIIQLGFMTMLENKFCISISVVI